MIDVRIGAGQPEIQRAQNLLRGVRGGASTALARALNRALEGTRTDAVRAVRETYLIKAGDIRETITIKKAGKDDLEARLTSRGSALGVQHFSVTPKTATKRPPIGVRVRIRKDSSPAPVPGAFMTGRLVGVFVREGPARLPLRRLHGPAVPSMIGTVVAERDLEPEAYQRFTRELDHQIDYLLLKGAR